MENKATGMFVIPPWLLFVSSVAALMTELSGETRPSFTGCRLCLLTVGVKHSGDKANRGRLVGVLLRELYQKLKCACQREEGVRGRERVSDTVSLHGGNTNVEAGWDGRRQTGNNWVAKNMASWTGRGT